MHHQPPLPALPHCLSSMLRAVPWVLWYAMLLWASGTANMLFLLLGKQLLFSTNPIFTRISEFRGECSLRILLDHLQQVEVQTGEMSPLRKCLRAYRSNFYCTSVCWTECCCLLVLKDQDAQRSTMWGQFCTLKYCPSQNANSVPIEKYWLRE